MMLENDIEGWVQALFEQTLSAIQLMSKSSILIRSLESITVLLRDVLHNGRRGQRWAPLDFTSHPDILSS